MFDPQPYLDQAQGIEDRMARGLKDELTIAINVTQEALTRSTLLLVRLICDLVPRL